MHPWCTHERTNNIFVSSESAWMTWSNADFQRFSWGTSSQRRRKSQIARPLWLNWTNDKAGSILHPLHCMRITNLHVYPLGIWHSSRYGQLARLYIDDLPSGNGHVPWQVVKLPEGSRGYMPCPKLLAIALAGQVFLLTPAGKLDTLSLLTFGPEVTCWLDQRNGSHLRFVQLHSTKMKASDKVLNVVGSFLIEHLDPQCHVQGTVTPMTSDEPFRPPILQELHLRLASCIELNETWTQRKANYSDVGFQAMRNGNLWAPASCWLTSQPEIL